MNLECPKCKFQEIKKINDKLYKCQICLNIFEPIPIKIDPLHLLIPQKSYPKVAEVQTEIKDSAQKIKYNKHIKGEGSDAEELLTIEYENTTGTPKAPLAAVKQTNGICKEVVLHLINEMQPSEFSAAAFKIKECVIRDVKELHNIELNNNPNLEAFNQITKDLTISKYCEEIWVKLNQFTTNDEVIKKCFINDQSKKHFFIEALDFYETTNIIKKK